jgi:hypothetical protein
MKLKTLKYTPTCSGPRMVHHQGVMSCAQLKLQVLVQYWQLLRVWSVFDCISYPWCLSVAPVQAVLNQNL